MTLAQREALDWLLEQPCEENPEVSGASREVLEGLSRRGASFLSDLVTLTRRLPTDVEEALWSLAAAGRVTADSLDALRHRINGGSSGERRRNRPKHGRPLRRTGYSRWSLLEAVSPQPDPVEPRAHQLLRRYGVLFPELLVREPMAPRWRDLVRVLRRLEARGEIRGGRFVAGFVGEQFALPEAVEMLRHVKNSESEGQLQMISACDPLNLVGILTPGERVPTALRNKVVIRDGVPLCSLENGNLVVRAGADEAALVEVRSLLCAPIARGRRSPPLVSV